MYVSEMNILQFRLYFDESASFVNPDAIYILLFGHVYFSCLQFNWNLIIELIVYVSNLYRFQCQANIFMLSRGVLRYLKMTSGCKVT